MQMYFYTFVTGNINKDKMRKILTIIILVPLIFSCVQPDNKLSSDKDTLLSNSKENNTEIRSNWYSELIIDYINNSENELIKLTLKDTTQIEWFLDRRLETDSAKYLIFHIGHDVIDEGNINLRFVTDGWVYIDSETRKLFEYDIYKDRIIEWNK
ncbi:MAG: hypothetical protein DRJ05_15265 [Bacteroidetes bacterium]|nr:MAG: hypothetical protein DRJ05_15265 [Bacteroidota bacterium]